MNTSELIFRMFGKEPKITGNQGAENLAHQIIDSNSALTKKLLYLCGDNSSTLPHSLFLSNNYDILQVLCYSTSPISSSQFQHDLNRVLPSLYATVFFSPSGVSLASECIDRNFWEGIRVLSIGETTAKALRDKIGRCDGVAKQSNLDGVKELLIEELRRVSIHHI